MSSKDVLFVHKISIQSLQSIRLQRSDSLTFFVQNNDFRIFAAYFSCQTRMRCLRASSNTCQTDLNDDVNEKKKYTNKHTHNKQTNRKIEMSECVFVCLLCVFS